MVLPVSTTRRAGWGTSSPGEGFAEATLGLGDSVVVVLRQLEGEDGLPELRWRLREAVLAGARTVVVDAAGVQDLSSGMISALLTTHRLCRVRGGGVQLLDCERNVLELLERTSLWRVFGVRQTTSGAPLATSGAH